MDFRAIVDGVGLAKTAKPQEDGKDMVCSCAAPSILGAAEPDPDSEKSTEEERATVFQAMFAREKVAL